MQSQEKYFVFLSYGLRILKKKKEKRNRVFFKTILWVDLNNSRN